MRRAAVITVGCKNESLGAFKVAAWLRRSGWDVEHKVRLSPLFDRGIELFAFSIVFSWRLPELVQQVNAAKALGGEILIGGPAVTFHRANREYVINSTGIEPFHGIDDRFEREATESPMVYFSRGCPAYSPACGCCPVPFIEGNAFRFYPDAKPSRMLLDNNLSALPVEYQEHIIGRYAAEWRGGRVDANSGFEPHTFDAETLRRWKSFPLECWRFGYDDLTERDQAIDMMRRLVAAGYHGKRVRVYTLIGNEPIAACHQRIREVIDRGCEPVPQRLRPLDWLGGPLPCRHDWDEATLIAFQRFYAKPQLWKAMQPDDFYYQGRYPLRVKSLTGTARRP